jgi:hypothetical protein
VHGPRLFTEASQDLGTLSEIVTERGCEADHRTLSHQFDLSGRDRLDPRDVGRPRATQLESILRSSSTNRAKQPHRLILELRNVEDIILSTPSSKHPHLYFSPLSMIPIVFPDSTDTRPVCDPVGTIQPSEEDLLFESTVSGSAARQW